MKQTANLTLAMLSVAGWMLAQDPSGWRRMSDPPPAPAATSQKPAASSQNNNEAARQMEDPSQPVDRSDSYGQPAQQDPAAPPQHRPAYGLPPQLTLKPGTYVTVRINQPLSTDRNHVGDMFSASLMSPVIVDGIVVANRGEQAYGRIAELEKQHSDRPSRLGLELTGIVLADGTQAPVASHLVAQQGRTTPGSVQAGTVVGTTAVGAAIGGAAAWGTGAAVGAGVGAAAGLVGVVLTRHHATVIYPETALTFQITSPVTIVTANSPQAFRFVGAGDYPSYSYTERPAPQLARPAPPAYYYGGYYDPFYYSPYYYGWGPSIYIGGGWGGYWGRGWGGWGRGWGGGFRGGFRGRR